MRKYITPPLVLQKKRERKQKRKQNRLKKIQSSANKANVFQDKYLEMSDAVITGEIIKINKVSTFGDRKSRKFRIPDNFDIFSNPEGSLHAINRIANILLGSKIRKLHLNHQKVVKNSLGSESLLGLVVSEIVLNRHDKSRKKYDFTLSGQLPRKTEARQLTQSVGLIKEMTVRHDKLSDNMQNNNILYFSAESRPEQSFGVKFDDKSKAAEDCVSYLESCLNKHDLTINKNIQHRLQACLGEILDNADEHSSRTRSNWYVKGYFNDTENEVERFLELSVFNVGNSIYDNFKELHEGSEVKGKAKKYVSQHNSLVSESCLYSVYALQGSVSTKRDQDPTRGQGTVTLIETFESIYADYRKLRDKDGCSKAEMNIISGDTVISFTGEYKSTTKQVRNGTEIFEMPFNEKNSLSYPPDIRYVKKMDKVFFPGVMINIRIPLQGSTKVLDKGK
ncbi:hypothetical protein [Providencia sp. PROV144]|uniref:hypothetical protein n=1 Tax=Providencia sp. PROV144 TaxID=2949854 RepID=UPI00234B5BB6|nr:hypothetical protein [Providencia sp. PROV144]